MAHDQRRLYKALAARDAAVRRRLLRRCDVHRHLLPADLPGENAAGKQLPVLPHRPGDRAGRLSSVPALPARAGAGKRAGGRCPADRAADRPAAGGRRDRRECRARRNRRPVRAQLAADPPHRPEGARRAADPAAADAAAAPGQAAAHGNRAAGDRDRLRQRVLEPPPIQRRIQRALQDGADAAAEEGDRRRGGDRRQHDVDAAALLSASLRLERCARVSVGARADGHRVGDLRGLCADRDPGRRERLDSRDPRAHASAR